jgi:hypothetical protein
MTCAIGANIGNAKIEGLATDLNLGSLQYNLILSLFFIPYILLGILHIQIDRQIQLLIQYRNPVQRPPKEVQAT